MLYEDAAVASLFESWANKANKLALSLDAFKLSPAHPDSYRPLRTHSHDIAILQFSSGSTGQPKAVIVTHGMVMAQLINLVENHTRSTPWDSRRVISIMDADPSRHGLIYRRIKTVIRRL